MLKHFFLLVIGKPGSGKSHVVRELISNSKYYKGKFDKVLIVSPSAQKIGFVADKDKKNTVYDLQWIFNHIQKSNEQQIKKFQTLLRGKRGKNIIPYIPQSIIEQSFKEAIKDPTKSQKLPATYVMFNKSQRFFSMEILAAMNQGFSTMHQPTVAEQSKKGRAGTGTKRKSKEEAKMSANDLPQTSEYKDVDDIERQLVSKLSKEEIEQTNFNMLIILDDVIGDIKANENNSSQTQLFFN